MGNQMKNAIEMVLGTSPIPQYHRMNIAIGMQNLGRELLSNSFLVKGKKPYRAVVSAENSEPTALVGLDVIPNFTSLNEEVCVVPHWNGYELSWMKDTQQERSLCSFLLRHTSPPKVVDLFGMVKINSFRGHLNPFAVLNAQSYPLKMQPINNPWSWRPL